MLKQITNEIDLNMWLQALLVSFWSVDGDAWFLLLLLFIITCVFTFMVANFHLQWNVGVHVSWMDRLDNLSDTYSSPKPRASRPLWSNTIMSFGTFYVFAGNFEDGITWIFLMYLIGGPIHFLYVIVLLLNWIKRACFMFWDH